MKFPSVIWWRAIGWSIAVVAIAWFAREACAIVGPRVEGRYVLGLVWISVLALGLYMTIHTAADAWMEVVPDRDEGDDEDE